MNTRNVIVLQGKSQSGERKLNCNQERQFVCGFEASSPVLIFALIGHNTINIPEIFQVFTVLTAQTSVSVENLQCLLRINLT